MFSQLRHLVPLEFSLVFLLGDVPSKQFNKILEIIYSQDKFLVCLILVFLIIELFSKKSIFFFVVLTILSSTNKESWFRLRMLLLLLLVLIDQSQLIIPQGCAQMGTTSEV